MQLTIPRPAVVLLIGPSGSGKSTFARRHFLATEILSSDACRAWVSDDEADQSASQDAFQLLHAILKMRLARGRLTVVDATNVKAWSRSPLLAAAREFDVPCAAIVFDLPPEVCAAQNERREVRTVAAPVIEQQSRDLAVTLQELPGERVFPIYHFHTPQDVDTAKIRLEN